MAHDRKIADRPDFPRGHFVEEVYTEDDKDETGPDGRDGLNVSTVLGAIGTFITGVALLIMVAAALWVMLLMGRATVDAIFEAVR
jgi:hypothetical protein